MKAYIFRKIIGVTLILVGVTLQVFLVLRALPGDPARLMAAGYEATQDAVDVMRSHLGLDRLLARQDAHFDVNALQGDFDTSIRSRLPVTSEIGERLPFTLALAFCAYLLVIAVGTPIGMIGAVYRRRWPDYAVMFFVILGASVAIF